MAFRVLVDHEEEGDAPDGADGAEDVEDRGPATGEAVIRQQAAERHGYYRSKLGSCGIEVMIRRVLIQPRFNR